MIVGVGESLLKGSLGTPTPTDRQPKEGDMRIMTFPETRGQYLVVVVPAPTTKKPPVYLVGETKEEVIGQLRTVLGVDSQEPA